MLFTGESDDIQVKGAVSIYVTGRKTISTSEILVSSGVAAAAGRKSVIIFNDSATVEVFMGPTGLVASSATRTGILISPKTGFRIDLSDTIFAYLRTEAGSADVIIQELG